MKTLQPTDIPAALTELEAELGTIDQRLAQLSAVLPAPAFDAHAGLPLNAAARILRILEIGRQEDLSLLSTRLRVARVQCQQFRSRKAQS